MDTLPQSESTGAPPSPESPGELRERLAWEAKCIAEGMASIAAGDVVPWEDVKFWLDSLDTDYPLPLPRPRQ